MSLCICVVLKILIQSLGEYMVNGISDMVVTVDPEHHDLSSIACNKSRLARMAQNHSLVVATVGSEQQLVECGFLAKHLPFVTGLLFFPCKFI